MDQLQGVVLPRGLTVRKRGEGLETAASNAGAIHLLFAHQALEVIEGTLQKGKRLHLFPSAAPDWRGSEIYLILSGSLSYEVPVCSLTLEPGDYLIADALQEPVIFSAQTDIRFLYITSQPTFHEISETLADLKHLITEVEQKDQGETADHCRRMRTLSYTMGQELRLSHFRLHLLDYAAYFHDVGKVVVPINILRKPASLSPGEWRIIKKHPGHGKELLDATFMREAGPIVEQHHERYDGSGYPYGLATDDILTEAYIVAVADAYDAMTSNRPYRDALPRDEAFSEIRRYSGQHYPSSVVEAFFSAVEKLNL